MKIETIRTSQAFEKLQKEWNALLKKTPANNIFLTWEWLFTWWKHYGKGKDLHILLAREGENLLGIAPLYASSGIMPMIRFLGDEGVHSNYLDFIIQSDDITQLFLKTLAKKFLYLRYIEQASPLFSVIKKNKRIMELSRCPLIRLPGSEQEFLLSLSKSRRRNLRYAENKIFRDFDAEITFITEKNDIKDGLKVVFHLNKSRWEDEVFEGEFDTKLKSFLREAAGLFAVKKWLEIVLLTIDKKPAAYCLNFLYNKTVSFYSLAYNPKTKDATHYSFGTCVQYNAIKRAIQDNYKLFDMLRGVFPYKTSLADSLKINFGLIRHDHSLKQRAAAASLCHLNALSHFMQKNASKKTQARILRIVPKKVIEIMR